jgi:hypothetical protein
MRTRPEGVELLAIELVGKDRGLLLEIRAVYRLSEFFYAAETSALAV